MMQSTITILMHALSKYSITLVYSQPKNMMQSTMTILMHALSKYSINFDAKTD